MKTNDAGLQLIKDSEGFIDHWYPDPAHGWKVPTCCIGHTDAAGMPFYKDTKTKKFTLKEGLDILAGDLGPVESAVSRNVKVSLNENQFSALVSFVFNLGEGNFKSSTLLKKLNSGDYKGAADELPKWVKANGKRMRGLEIRRDKERTLFLTPVEEKTVEIKPVEVHDDECCECTPHENDLLASVWKILVGIL